MVFKRQVLKIAKQNMHHPVELYGSLIIILYESMNERRIEKYEIHRGCKESYTEFFVKNAVEPRYPDTLRTRKKCRHKRSVAATGVGEIYVFKKLYFIYIYEF